MAKLPVGPVTNPGEAAIKATINPVEHEFLFFLADRYRNTYFSKTDAEHEATKAKLKTEGKWFD
ncbi:MAG: endolytic transglycosylase MltG [Bacilli bacterium]